jgi:hypothetical protein
MSLHTIRPIQNDPLNNFRIAQDILVNLCTVEHWKLINGVEETIDPDLGDSQ